MLVSHISFKHDNIKYVESKFLLNVLDPKSNTNSVEQNQINKKNFLPNLAFIGIGLLVASLIIFAIVGFSQDTNLESQVSEKTIPEIESSVQPKITQTTERFGNAYSIMPSQIQPAIPQPILENYDKVKKPQKNNLEN